MSTILLIVLVLLYLNVVADEAGYHIPSDFGQTAPLWIWLPFSAGRPGGRRTRQVFRFHPRPVPASGLV